MQTNLSSQISQLIHPEKNKQTFTERLFHNLGTSNYGLNQNTQTISSSLDSFEITENISELLSPACGMTDEEKEQYMAQIMAKLKSGKKLSAEEMRFLQSKNPVLYQQAARVQSMRDSLETRLEHCNSKNEATDIFSSAMSSVSDSDPMKEYITAAYQDVMKEFKHSDEYRNLPQDDEDENSVKHTL